MSLTFDITKPIRLKKDVSSPTDLLGVRYGISRNHHGKTMHLILYVFSTYEDPIWFSEVTLNEAFENTPEVTVKYANAYNNENTPFGRRVNSIEEANCIAGTKRIGMVRVTYEDGKIISVDVLSESEYAQ